MGGPSLQPRVQRLWGTRRQPLQQCEMQSAALTDRICPGADGLLRSAATRVWTAGLSEAPNADHSWAGRFLLHLIQCVLLSDLKSRPLKTYYSCLPIFTSSVSCFPQLFHLSMLLQDCVERFFVLEVCKGYCDICLRKVKLCIECQCIHCFLVSKCLFVLQRNSTPSPTYAEPKILQTLNPQNLWMP